MIDLDRLEVHPNFEPNPWLAVGLIRVDGEEIVGAVFFDHAAGAGYVVDDDGVADTESVDVDATGWYVQVLAEGSPSLHDPREVAPCIDYVGDDDLPLSDAFAAGLETIAERGQVLGLSDEQARGRLLWRPHVDDETGDLEEREPSMLARDLGISDEELQERWDKAAREGRLDQLPEMVEGLVEATLRAAAADGSLSPQLAEEIRELSRGLMGSAADLQQDLDSLGSAEREEGEQ